VKDQTQKIEWRLPLVRARDLPVRVSRMRPDSGNDLAITNHEVTADDPRRECAAPRAEVWASHPRTIANKKEQQKQKHTHHQTPGPWRERGLKTERGSKYERGTRKTGYRKKTGRHRTSNSTYQPRLRDSIHLQKGDGERLRNQIAERCRIRHI